MLVFSVIGTCMLKLPWMLGLRGKKALHVMFFSKIVQVGFCLLSSSVVDKEKKP